MDQAARSVQSNLVQGSGGVPRGETVPSLPEDAASIFDIELTLAGEKVKGLVVALADPLIEAWKPQASGATDAADRPAPPTLDVLLDVELPLSVSFGRTFLPIREVLKLSTGSIVELNCPANEYVEVIVNNCAVARGEVVVVEGNYGVRIHEIVSRHERLQLQHKKGSNPARPMRIGQ